MTAACKASRIAGHQEHNCAFSKENFIRKRSSVARRDDIRSTDWKISFLVSGQRKLPPDDPELLDEFLFAGDPRSQAEVWKLYGAEILANYIKKHPGKRPWYWWQEHIKNTNQFREVRPEGVISGGYHVGFGLPKLKQAKGIEIARIESEPAYLKRHGLASSSELARLNVDDFKPIIIGFNIEPG